MKNTQFWTGREDQEVCKCRYVELDKINQFALLYLTGTISRSLMRVREIKEILLLISHGSWEWAFRGVGGWELHPNHCI